MVLMTPIISSVHVGHIPLKHVQRTPGEETHFFKTLHRAHRHAKSVISLKEGEMHSGEEIAIGLANIKNVSVHHCCPDSGLLFISHIDPVHWSHRNRHPTSVFGCDI